MTADRLPMRGDDETWRYLPALDGLRALAVVTVVIFHTAPRALPGGFIGVDLFFVLSGYLITALLMSEYRSSGRVDLQGFWGRRVRRLMPAVLALVATVSVVTSWLGTTSARSLVDAWGSLTWSTNWLELALADRTWWMADLRTVLDHLWSLSVEEQFYLVWPLVILALLGKSSRRVGFAVLVVAGLVSAAISGVIGAPAAYFRTDARAFELIGGAILAWSGWRPSRRLAGPLIAGGLGGWFVLLVVGDPNGSWMYPWGLLVVTAASVALVAGGTAPPNWARALLAYAPARRVGQLSYGIYLWHIPVLRVFHADRVGVDGVWLQIIRLAVLSAIVWASFTWIEQPLRRSPSLLRSPRFLVLGIAAVASTLLMIPGAQRSIDRQWQVSDDRPPPVAQADQYRVLVVGDLVAGVLGAGLIDTGEFAVWNTADLGCPFGSPGSFDLGDGPEEIPEFCRRWSERWDAAVERFDPDVVVVATGLWDTLPWVVDGRETTDVVDEVRLDALAVTQAGHLAGARRPVVAVTVDDVTGLSPADQPRDDDRRRRSRVLASSVAEAFGGVGVRSEGAVMTVDGAPDAAEVRRFGREKLAQVVLELASARP